MVNSNHIDHIDIIKQGIDTWNVWRKRHPEIHPDLSGADLKRTDLTGANLTEVNLTDANLSGAHLNGANLTGAIFKSAILYETSFANANLSYARGLDLCYHLGPSSVDIRTLRQSWPLPRIFLQGCGFDEGYINYLRKLFLDKKSVYYSCFISYSGLDDIFALKIYKDLTKFEVKCWLAVEDMKGGKKIDGQLTSAIDKYDKFLLILSKNSMRSGWVAREVKKALTREKTEGRELLFPITIADFDLVRSWNLLDSNTGIDLADEVRSYYIPDFSEWENDLEYKQLFEGLLRDLKR